MTSKVSSALQKFEKLVENGKIDSFSVYIQNDSILIKPAGSETGKEIVLTQELLSSLRIFFYGVASIEYNSFDYATLKSFINASILQNKIAS